MTRIPVLTYHSTNVSGNDYATNDHVALAADLRAVGSMGLQVKPLAAIVDAYLARELASLRGCVAFTFDDGSNLDYYDLEHPTWGLQRSFFNLLQDFAATPVAKSGPPVHGTCFVIASPDQRRHLDRACYIGAGWWTDAWWQDAHRSGLLSIENHSWDHNHESLPAHDLIARRGDFHSIDSRAAADYEVRQAADYIDGLIGTDGGTSLFAYPYGQASPYLVDEYFPQGQFGHRVRAAFTTEPDYLTEHSNRWLLPRFVCGRDWSSPEALKTLLRQAGNSGRVL